MNTKTGEYLNSELIYDSNIFQLYIEQHRLSNGQVHQYHTIHATNWVAIIPITSDGELVMVEQYRAAWQRPSLEFPAGKCHSGEDFLACAKRELREETGYTASAWEHLYTAKPVTWTNQDMQVYVAQDLTLGPTEFDEEEDIKVVLIKSKEFWGLVRSGELIDVPTIANYGMFVQSNSTS